MVSFIKLDESFLGPFRYLRLIVKFSCCFINRAEMPCRYERPAHFLCPSLAMAIRSVSINRLALKVLPKAATAPAVAWHDPPIHRRRNWRSLMLWQCFGRFRDAFLFGVAL